MPKATLTKRLEFCSSHRYHNPNWDAEKNRAVFGPCNNENTHGHNYLLEVTLRGDIDPVTGMIINLYDLKQYLWDVLIEFDHKNLNLDTPYFIDRIPTTENVAITLWDLFRQHPELPALDRIRLHEDDRLYAEVCAEWVQEETNHSTASLSRLYTFSAVHQSHQKQLHGHHYDLWTTFKGPIPSDTGQIIDLQALDRTVTTQILDRFDQREINQDPAIGSIQITDSSLAQVFTKILTPLFDHPPLYQLSVSQQPGTHATCSL